MVECELTKSGLTIYVRSQVKPNSKMSAECGFKKDVALLVVAALAEDCNKKFGDNIDPRFCVRAVATFIGNRTIGINCRCCGWRKPQTQFCTQKNCNTGDGQTCELFRHLFVVEPE